MEIIREYYEHNLQCSGKNFTELNSRGIKTCLDCAGQFDAKGKGVCVTDKRFDEPR